MTLDEISRSHFGAILIDPPWRFKTYNEKGRLKCPDWKPFKGSPSLHYDTMGHEELTRLPVKDFAAKDACLFLWITWPMLLDAIALIKAWDFAYKTCGFCWVKARPGKPTEAHIVTQMGTGYWTRANSEVCLLATRGKPKRVHADVRQAIIEPRREHSRKPDCVHERIERLVAGPYLELFGRQQRPNWTVWGNETTKFDAPSAS